jgi:Zn-dependent M16 (insulinase) family peptidase
MEVTMKLIIILIITTFLISCGKKEKKEIKNKGFKLVETREIKNLGATSYTYEHIKTGARVVYLDDESAEKVFGIAFKTPVVDNTGVNHVFEHSVLAGSKKFPDKNLFSELDTKNIPTFLNAMTGTDYTIYPFSAVEPKSFDNLMDVYLDAVFNPMVLEDENILKREGWRFDRNLTNNELIFNGIVYNEMRGAFSNPYRTLFHKMNLITYPDEMANYRFSSGGLPSAIPNLNLDQLRKTHAKYYTPSNSIVVLGGKMDIDKHLKLLDEYFSKYDKTEKAVLEVQKTPLKDELHNETYPAPKESPNIYVYTTLMKPQTSVPELSFITSLLADYEISPLKKLFKENKFTGNFGLYIDSSFQPRGYIMVQGANEKEIADIRKLIDSKIEELSKIGIDPEIIDLALRDYKKELAKSQYSSQRAEDLTTTIASSYFYYDKPLLMVSDDKIKILEELSKNPDKIKALIKEYYAENKNKVEIFFTPNPEGLEELALNEKDILKKYESTLSPTDHKKLDDEIKTFNEWTKSPVDKKITDSIPTIKLTDLKDSKISTVEIDETDIDGIKTINNHINTYDINLVSLKFDSSGFTKEDKLKAKLYSILVTSSSTKDYSYDEISNNLTKYFFKLNLSNSTNIVDNNELSRRYTINFEYLQNDNKEVYSTLENLFFENNFDNKLEIKNRLNLLKDGIINSLSDSGVVNKASTLKALSMSNPYYNYVREDQIPVELLPIITKILNNYDEEFPKLQNDMKEIQNKIFNKENLLIFYANEGNFDNFKKDITPLLNKMKKSSITPTNYAQLDKEKIAITAPVQNGTTSWGNNLNLLGYKYSGKYKIMANMLNEYLNSVIRVQNGAYGAWFYFTLNNDMLATSYRDGEIDKTLTTFENMPKFLEEAKDMPQEKFDGFILKSMTKYYQSYTPDQLLAISYTRYLYNMTLESMEKEKSEVLATTKDDLPEFIEIMNKFIANEYYNTINSENIIKEKSSKYKFDKTIKFEKIK